jgi:hypothetical protein
MRGTTRGNFRTVLFSVAIGEYDLCIYLLLLLLFRGPFSLVSTLRSYLKEKVAALV